MCASPRGHRAETSGQLRVSLEAAGGGCRPLRVLVCLRVAKRRSQASRLRAAKADEGGPGGIGHLKNLARLLPTSRSALRHVRATRMAFIDILKGRIKTGRSYTAKIATCLIGSAASRLSVVPRSAIERQSSRSGGARAPISTASSRCKGPTQDGAGSRVYRGEGWSVESTLVIISHDGRGTGRISPSRCMTAPIKERPFARRAIEQGCARGG